MNRKNKSHQSRQVAPPRWAERLLSRITAPHLRDEVIGDLYELFQRRVQRYGQSPTIVWTGDAATPASPALA
ncbi:permease prefix domain 2-containing transporter [Spirosoma fluminis]